VIKHIRQTFHEEPNTAVAVAACESGFNPTAYNDKNYNDSVDRGIFQLNSTHDSKLRELGLDPWNVVDNIEFARLLYEQSGWQPWVCYTKGMLVMR